MGGVWAEGEGGNIDIFYDFRNAYKCIGILKNMLLYCFKEVPRSLRTTLATARRCHMCGEPDSQHHCFRGCSHSNVKAVRIETTRALQDYERDHSRSLGATAEDLQTVSLMRGIIHEYNNCADAGRVWTGNWDRTMITRLQISTDTANISKKQCRKLRKVLHPMYAIIAQGANDIM